MTCDNLISKVLCKTTMADPTPVRMIPIARILPVTVLVTMSPYPTVVTVINVKKTNRANYSLPVQVPESQAFRQ
jgi:hypothetical protein